MWRLSQEWVHFSMVSCRQFGLRAFLFPSVCTSCKKPSLVPFFTNFELIRVIGATCYEFLDAVVGTGAESEYSVLVKQRPDSDRRDTEPGPRCRYRAFTVSRRTIKTGVMHCVGYWPTYIIEDSDCQAALGVYVIHSSLSRSCILIQHKSHQTRVDGELLRFAQCLSIGPLNYCVN